jgi:hypothetical protein
VNVTFEPPLAGAQPQSVQAEYADAIAAHEHATAMLRRAMRGVDGPVDIAEFAALKEVARLAASERRRLMNDLGHPTSLE